MNRLDHLIELAEKGEGLLSCSLSPNGVHDFSRNLELVDMLVASGMNQLLIITYSTNTYRLAELAPAERTFVKMGIERGAYESMWEDNVKAIRERYPDLPIIVTPMIGDAIAFGQHRFLNKCVELGVDGVDTASYRAVNDPCHFRRDCEERNLGLIQAVTGGAIQMDKPETVEVMDEMVKTTTKEMFFVPAVPGTKNVLKGADFARQIKRIREVQKENDLHFPIIAIGGISSAEDAYQMVKVAGADGVHFSSAFMNKLFAGEPLEQVSAWFKEVKAAMKH